MKPLSEPEPKVLPSRSYSILDSHQRMLERQAVREENARKDREATEAMAARRNRMTVDDRVSLAVGKLRGRTPVAAIQLIQSLSDHDRDAYLLAEEIGENREQVLRSFPAVRKSVRLAWEGEVASQPEVEAPAETQPEADVMLVAETTPTGGKGVSIAEAQPEVRKRDAHGHFLPKAQPEEE